MLSKYSNQTNGINEEEIQEAANEKKEIQLYFQQKQFMD